MMSKSLKISLTLLALVLALLVLLIARVLTLDPNDYKDWITSQFQSQTGLELALDGNISLSVYPWLGVGVEQVTVSNRAGAGFGDLPLLQAEAAQARVKLLPLLRQRYEIDTVQLRGVSLNLIVNESGVGNWTAGPAEPGGAETTAPGGAGLPLTRVILGGVDISDVNLRYEDRRTATVYQINNLAFTVGELVYGIPIDLAMTLDAVSNRPALSATAELSGTLNYDLDNGLYQLEPLTLRAELAGDTLPDAGASIDLRSAMAIDLATDSLRVTELSVTGLGASLQADLQGQAVNSAAPVYEGNISLSGDDLAGLFAAAGVADLANRLASLSDRRFTLQAGASYQGADLGAVELQSLSATLLGAELDASLGVSGVRSDNPNARGRLDATGPDLPLVVEVLGQLSGGDDALLTRVSEELRRVPDRPFNVGLEFEFFNNGGSVSVPALQAQLLGASLSGEFQATGIDTDTPRINGVVDASGPDLPLLLQLGALFQGGTESSPYQVARRLRDSSDGAFLLNARFDADLEQGNINIPELSASALGWQIDGRVDATNMSDRNGRVSGNLSVESNNASPVLIALEQGDLAEIVERVSVNLEVSGSRDALAIAPLQAGLVVSGPRIPGSPVTVALDAAGRINLDRESLDIESVTVSGLGLDARGSFSVEQVFDEPAYQGQLAVAEFNLRNFLQQLNQPVPVTRDSSVLRRVGFNARVDGSTDRLAVEGLNLTLDDTTLSGNFSLLGFTEPKAEFNIEIDRLDADRYLAPEQASTGNSAAGDSAELPVEMLRNLALLGELQIGELAVAGLELQNVAITVNAADGELNLAPLAVELYQGSFAGALGLSVAGAEPQARLEANLQGVNLAPLLLDLLDASYLAGRGNIRLALSSTGADLDTLKRTLSGDGSLAIEDGVLTGVDVAAVLKQLETMIRSRRAGVPERGTQTAFDSFSGTITVDEGVIRSNDILIQSPGFRVTGRGTLLDLADNAINFNLLTEVDQSTATLASQQYDIGGYSLPIACTGTMENPACLPDAGEILRARLQREVQNRVLDLLDRSTGVERDQPAAQSSDTPPTSPDLQTDTQQTSPDSQTETQPEPEQQDIRDQILNRALDRIFN